MGDSNVNTFLMFTTTSPLNETTSLSWSPDDHICLLTDRGAFIFSAEISFSDSSTTLYPHKYFIPNPEDQVPLSFQTSLKRFIDYQQAKFDWFDCIHLTEGFASQHNKYRLACWSPRIKQIGSILALLTYDHRLLLFTYHYTEWKQLADCSNLLDVGSGFYNKQSKLSAVKTFELYTKLSVQSMTWSSIYEVDGIETVLLICGSESGYCHFFHLTLGVDGMISIELIKTWTKRSGLNSITSCFWFADYLVLCSLDGLVLLLKMQIEKLDQDADDWTASPKLTLWSEADDIPVQELILQENRTNGCTIFFTKNNHLIILAINESIDPDDKVQLCVETVKPNLTSCKTYFTGMCSLSNDTLILSSPDGLVTTVGTKDCTVINESSHPINSEEVASNLTPLSIATSHNNVLTCVAQSITKFHDHLLLKEPTRIIIFPNITFESLTTQIGAMIKDRSLANRLDSLHDIMDLLNALRGYYYNNLQWIPEELDDLLKMKENWNQHELGIKNFKILRFVCLSLDSNTSAIPVDEMESVLALLEKWIQQEHIKHMISINADEEARSGLNEDQLVSLNNMLCWTAQCNVDGSQVDSKPEECPICKSDVSMDDPKNGKCSKNHRFGRCCNSLILCANSYQPCKLCGRCSFIVPSVWSNHYGCLYCY